MDEEMIGSEKAFYFFGKWKTFDSFYYITVVSEKEMADVALQ